MKNKLIMLLTISAALISACENSNAGKDESSTYKITSSENIRQNDTNENNNDEKSNEDSTTEQTTKINLSEENYEITEAGTYEISGDLEDGSLVIDSDDGDIKLILNNVTINSQTATPINIKSAGKVEIILEDGSTNTITQASIDTEDEDFPSAALFSQSDLKITGNGSLIVKTEYNDAITSKDTLTITSGTIAIDAAQDGMVGKDELIIDGGDITITSGKKALRSTKTDEGKVTINDGQILIKSEHEGIEGYFVEINGGDIDITSSDDGINAKSDTSEVQMPGARMNPPQFINEMNSQQVDDQEIDESSNQDTSEKTSYVEINGGTILINASGDGIDSNGDIKITGGKTTINTQTIGKIDTSIDADGEITKTGGELIDENGNDINYETMANGQNGMGGPGAMGRFDPNSNSQPPQMDVQNMTPPINRQNLDAASGATQDSKTN